MLQKSCMYHENMQYCPVLLEIIPQRLKDFYRGNYLLQLFSKEGVCEYSKSLKCNSHPITD